MHRTRTATGPIAGALTLAAMLSAAVGQEPALELKLTHAFPSSHPLHAAASDWAEAVAKDANGTINIHIRADGKAFDQYDLARTGASDIAVAHPGLQIGRFPAIAAGELPLLIASATAGSAAFHAWYRVRASQEMPDVHFCLAFVHDPGTVHAVRRKIAEPGDLKGMKVSAAQNTLAALIRLLGGRTVRAGEAELGDLLVRGVAQAVALPWQTAILSGTERVARNHLNLPLYTTPFALVINKRRHASMSATQRAAIDRHCTTPWAERIAIPWAHWERAGRDTMLSLKGHEVHAPTPAQVAAWRAAAEPVIATWSARMKRAGQDPDASLRALRAELAKNNAAF